MPCFCRKQLPASLRQLHLSLSISDSSLRAPVIIPHSLTCFTNLSHRTLLCPQDCLTEPLHGEYLLRTSDNLYVSQVRRQKLRRSGWPRDPPPHPVSHWICTVTRSATVPRWGSGPQDRTLARRRPSLFMVALCNRETIYIFMLWFVLLSFFFPRLISAAADWMSTILRHMVWS